MKIKYEFATETTEIEVTEEWGSILIELDRQEYNINHKERRRRYSLDACDFEGDDFACEDEALTKIQGGSDEFSILYDAIESLTEDQKDLVKKIFFEGYSVNDYAEMLGVGASAVSHRIQRIKARIKKFYIDRQI